MTSTSRARILIADDHVLVAGAICKLLSHDFKIVAMVHDGRRLIEAATELLPDVILADISMPVLNGLHAAKRIKRQLPNVKILCVTVTNEPDLIEEALKIGLDGYVFKTCAPAELLTAIRLALEGKRYVSGAQPLAELPCKRSSSSANMSHCELTDRQVDIVQLVAEGRSMKEAASVLNLTTRTVAFHKYRAMRRLNLRNDSQVVQYAVQHHIIASWDQGPIAWRRH
jgi:DNA-binding NarL/FixJ family response regulator